MLNRFPSTGFNRINLDWIMRRLKKVENVTDNIGTAVEDAQQAAAEATTAAAGAVAAASDATQAAEEAVEAISTVTDQAAQAVQTANAASATATGASNTAATALSRADSAQSTASGAASAAAAAQTTADGALAQADLAREEALAAITAATTSIHIKSGAIITGSDGNVITGYGGMSALVIGSRVIIHFEAVIDTAGTGTGFAWGIDAGVLSAEIGKTVIPDTGGILTYYSSNNQIDANLTGYCGTCEGAGDYWLPGRIYNTSGSIGGWSPNGIPAGTRIVGICYGHIA